MAALLVSMLLLGLASGVHCVAMCGGFAGAFAQARVIRIHAARRSPWGELALFNAGRITSYAAAGAVAGLLGGALGSLLGAQTALYALANAMLIAVGLHLAGLPLLNLLEKTGTPIWRALQPLATRAIGGSSAYFAGLFWGWLPCGLVYAALAAAAFAGSAAGGAAAMAAYGLGTLPWLMGAGFTASFLNKRVAGAAVLALGVYGLAHAEGIAGGLRAVLCL
jgi:hypothetical protein